MAGVAAYIDSQFLTNTVTLSAGLRPAAITNGATAVTSTGSTAAQINADLSAMLALITTAGAGLTWIMRPLTAYKIAATIGGTAAADIPRTLFGIPMILSLNSPAQITLVDANCILFSDDGGFDVDTTEQATLQMDDSPTDPAAASTVFEALWARNLWAVKVTRWLAYLRAQTGSVTYMTVADQHGLVQEADACRATRSGTAGDRRLARVVRGRSRGAAALLARRTHPRAGTRDGGRDGDGHHCAHARGLSREDAMKLPPEQLADAVVDTIRKAIDGPKVAGRLEALEQRIKELEARPPSVEYGGTFEAGTVDSKGVLVTRQGGLWLSLQDANAWPPGQSAEHWKLIVQRGEA